MQLHGDRGPSNTPIMLVLLYLLLAGCQVTLPDGVFHCESDDDCPTQMICSAAQRCIYPDSAASAQSAVHEPEAADEMEGEPQNPPAEMSAPEQPKPHEPAAPPQAMMAAAASGCREAKDCAAPNDCARVVCEAGRCVTRPVPENTPLPSSSQVKGDCQSIVCDGASGMKLIAADSDRPSDDANTCRPRTCNGGKPVGTPIVDGQACNGTGRCMAGECSVCTAGKDCTPADSCTVHQTECVNGKTLCGDTQQPVASKTCGSNRVCSAGECVECVLGAACGPVDLCQPGKITSCERGPVCTKAVLDGTSCGGDAFCRAGACAKSALVNGAFKDGLRGWTTAGDGARFPTSYSAVSGGNVRTNLNDAVDTPKGSISQRFTVPMDALALRFRVISGHAHVRLRNAAGEVVQDVVARDSNEILVPVSWDLTSLRGHTLSLSVEDELDVTGWSFIGVDGFDVIRDTPVGLTNPQFLDGLSGWTASGDAQYFNVFDDPNFIDRANDMETPRPEYGARRTVSSFVFDTRSPHTSDAATGSLSQRFVVPNDAVALRFYVQGGKSGRVALYDGASLLASASGMDSNDIKVPVAWDLRPHVGRTLSLALEDNADGAGWNFITTSGFDVITSYNGP